MGRNDEVAETQVDEIFWSGIKVDLVSLEDCLCRPRGKGVGRNVCVCR